MNLVLAFIYFSAFGIYLVANDDSRQNLRKAGFLTIFCGCILHTVYLCLIGIKTGYIPAFGMQHSVLLSSWAIAVFFICLFFKYKVDMLGGAVALFLGMLVLSAYFLPQYSYEGQADLNIFMIALHVFFTFFANAAFFVAFVLGLFYIFQEKNIKSKRHGIFFKRLPSLDILESAGNFCIIWGFVALTIGLATGIIWSKHIFGYFISFDPKEIWSFITWILYAAIIHGRLTSEWRGRKAAFMSILAFCIVIFSFIGINIFTDASHGEYFMGTGHVRG